MQRNGFVRILRRWDVILGLVMLSLTVYIKWNATRMPEHVVIPTHAMPKQNAFDYYQKAAEMIPARDDKQIRIDDRGRDIESPLDHYLIGSFMTGFPDDIDHPSEFIADTQLAHDFMHKGFVFRYVNPPVRSGLDDLMYLRNIYDVEGMLAARSKAFRLTKNYDAAFEDDIDMIKIGADIPQGSPMSLAFNGGAMQWQGVCDANIVVRQVSKGAIEAAIERLKPIDSEQVPIAQTLTEDKYFGQETIMRIFAKRSANISKLASRSDSFNIPSTLMPIVICSESCRGSYSDFSRERDDDIATSSKPWTILSGAYKKYTGDSLVADGLLEFDAATYTNTHYYIVAKTRLLLVRLALQEFLLDHQQYPSSISELVPHYIQSIPLDPFAENKPLLYKKRPGKNFVLYSVGLDGVDNGGAPLVSTIPGNQASEEELLSGNSKGETTGDIIETADATDEGT